jgi:hypothetical protein
MDIYPAIAIANELKLRFPDAEFYLLLRMRFAIGDYKQAAPKTT